MRLRQGLTSDAADGKIGGTAQKVANKTGAESLDKEGSIGKKFTSEGSIGGNVDAAAKGKK